MSYAKAIGDRIRLLRGERCMTRNELADKAGVNADVIEKLEHGRRQTARATWILRLARALGARPSDLFDGARRGEDGEDGDGEEGHAGERTASGVCDAVADPESTPGMDADDAGDQPDLGELRTAITEAWRGYRSGDFPRVSTLLPGLIGEARLASLGSGTKVAAPLADAHHLAARLLSDLGRTDLAVLATLEAIRAAEGGGDELRWTALHGAYSSALLHEGLTAAAESAAVGIAEDTQPPLDDAEARRLAVWGGLMLVAVAAAVTRVRGSACHDYVALARSAAGRFEHERIDYHVRFGQSEVARYATHAYAILQEPDLALRSAGDVHSADMPGDRYGRHLLDVAHAQIELWDLREAESTLQEAESLSRRSFRREGPACSLVGELVEEMAHVSPELRRMANAVGIEG